MGCFGPDPPPQRDVVKEYKETLAAQLAVTPQWYWMEKQYRPKFAELDINIAEKTLPRLLEMYRRAEPTLSALETESQRRRALEEMRLLREAGPQAVEAIRRSSGTDRLVSAMLRDAEEGLAQGADPRVIDALSQQVRAAQAARGMYLAGNPSASWEALVGADAARQMRQEAQRYAGQVAGLAQASGGDPLLTLLARPSQLLPAAPGAAQTAYGMTPGNIFNPESPYAGNLYASNQAYQWQYNQSQPSTLAKIGMVSNTVGDIAKAIGTVAGFACWVAREIYGVGDFRWVIFASWLKWRAPGWFRYLYYRFGMAWAKWLHQHPRLKRVVKWWMDRKVRQMERRVCLSLELKM